jgi:plasmid stability protein
MSTLTIRLPNDTHDRLRQLAALRGISLNKLMEEISIQTLSSFDAETRFRALAAQADPQRALAILDRLDQRNQTTR